MYMIFYIETVSQNKSKYNEFVLAKDDIQMMIVWSLCSWYWENEDPIKHFLDSMGYSKLDHVIARPTTQFVS